MSNIKTTVAVPESDLMRVALGALIVGAFAIGFGPIFVRSSEVGPTATAFWRVVLAVPVFWLGMNFEGQKRAVSIPSAPSRIYLWLGLAGLFYAADLAVWHWSLTLTSVANATLLTNFAPIFVTLGSWLIWRQRFSRTFILGMVVAILGAAMLIGQSFGLSLQHLLGDSLGLISALFYGSYI